MSRGENGVGKSFWGKGLEAAGNVSGRQRRGAGRIRASGSKEIVLVDGSAVLFAGRKRG
jgi:hypothetical protein